MKHYKDILVHGVQLVRHLKGQQSSDGSNELAIINLPIAAARGYAQRTLSRRAEDLGDDVDIDSLLSSLGLNGEDMEFGGGDSGGFNFGGEGDEDDFDLLSGSGGGEGGFDLGLGEAWIPGDDPMVDAIMENTEKCGIDITDMSNKTFGAFLMSRAGAGASTTSNSQSSLAMYRDLAISYNPILLALKDDDEEECSSIDSAQILLASEEYLQCSGVYDFFGSMDFQDDQTIAFMNGVTNECQPVIDLMMSAEDMEMLSMDALSTKLSDETATTCLQTLLGDNPFANYLRYTYQNLDQELDCLGRFGEALPHCVLTTDVSTESEGDAAFSMPLSLMKKLDCMISSSYESILDEGCDVMYTSLDKCFAKNAATADLAAVSACVNGEGLMLGKQDDLFGMDSSVLDGNNQVPAFCSRSFQRREVDTTALQSQLDQYNKKRTYGWTASKSLEDDADEVLEPPQESYNSEPQDIALLQSSEWNNGEQVSSDTETASSTGSFAIVVMVGVAIIAAVGLVLVVKRRALGNDQQFKPVFGGDNTLPSVV